MTRLDARKRAEWQKRLDEFEASGLTVAHFCRRTNVGPHTFYYWKKRLHPTSTQGRRRAAQHRGGTGSDEVPATANKMHRSDALVHFAWGPTLRISVPADCMGAIRCVLECTSRAGHHARDVAGPFQEVILAQ